MSQKKNILVKILLLILAAALIVFPQLTIKSEEVNNSGLPQGNGGFESEYPSQNGNGSPLFCYGDSGSKSTIVKVMTINLRHNLDFWEDRFPLAADEIVRLEPDIIGIQEMEIGIRQTQTLLRLIRDRTPGRELKYYVYEHLKTGADLSSGEGISILSKYPIEQKSFVDLGHGRPALFTRIKILPGLTADFYNVHLHHQGGDEVRLGQAKALADFMRRNGDSYIKFLTGDMNSDETDPAITFFTQEEMLVDTYNKFAANRKDAEDPRGDDPGLTSPVALGKNNPPQKQHERIDYIFAKAPESGPGARFRILDSVVCFKNANKDGLFPSDHLGVMTTLEVFY